MDFSVPIQQAHIQGPTIINLGVGYGSPGLELSRIIQLVCWKIGVEPRKLFTKDRTERVALARHVAMFLCFELLKMKHGEIGDHFMRDRSSATYAIAEIRDRSNVDEPFRRLLCEIRYSLR